MSFSYTRDPKDSSGVAYVTGTYNAASVTSGNIVTGLNNIKACFASGSSASAAYPIIDSTTTPGTMALTGLASSQTGNWCAIGI